MKVRRVRCSNCKSLNTIKNGKRKLLDYSLERKSCKKIQRYKCKECNHNFTLRNNPRERYTREFKLELTRMHLEERMSYRVISKRLREKYSIRISKTTVCKIVNQIAVNSKGDIKIKYEYQPSWQGYLTVDDKYLAIAGKKKMLLTATDSSGDIIHIELFREIEQDKIDDFFKFIKDHLNYPVKAITTDLDEMLEKSIKKEFGSNIPHQKCLKHAIDTIDKILMLKQKRKRVQKTQVEDKQEFRKNMQEFYEAEQIYKLCKQILYSKEIKQTNYLIKQLKNWEDKYPKLLKFFLRHLDGLIKHQKDTQIKKTNNIAENINRQLMRRLKTIESFEKFVYAENYLNLYKNYLRFKPYTDCRGINKIKNGKTPLEVCGVKLKTKDWLKNAVSFC